MPVSAPCPRRPVCRPCRRYLCPDTGSAVCSAAGGLLAARGTGAGKHRTLGAAVAAGRPLPGIFGFKLFQMDNYTDTIMLFEAASADETEPLTAMMTATAYNVDNFETLQDDLGDYLAARDQGKTGADIGLEPFPYARYWHGYLIWLRPLLLFLTYGQIRVFNYLVFAVLAAALLWQLWKHCGRWARGVVCRQSGGSHRLFRPPPGTVLHLLCHQLCRLPVGSGKTPHGGRTGCRIGGGGGCTAFLDLLVTPILTLGLPLTVWLLDTRVPDRTAPLRRCGAVLGGAVSWGGGYALCWASKWVLAGAVTGQDIIGDALHQASVRTSADSWHGIQLTWPNIFRFVFDTLNGRGLFWPLVILLVVLLAAFALCVRDRRALLGALPLLLAALSAPAWLALLRTHSIQHGWFTWRSLGVTVFAGLAFLHAACSPHAGRRRLFRWLSRKQF